MSGVMDISAYLEELLRRNDTNLSQQINELIEFEQNSTESNYVIEQPNGHAIIFDSILAIVYALIFLVGVSGNIIVCWVVLRNKHMRTVTNFFITNLGLADILLCTIATPITALEHIMNDWVFGKALCHLIPYSLGVSVYLSAFTLMAIAIDRYFVILHPFKPRMKISLCISIILFIWVLSLILTLPYGMYMNIWSAHDRTYCYENWPAEEYRRMFTSSTSVLQFIVPFIVIAYCYIRVYSRLSVRCKCMPGVKSLQKEELERKRTRRTNRMLITMVLIFGASWLPLNLYHLIMDFNAAYLNWKYSTICFFITHATAMSSTCYNPLLYAWLNENFRKEFKLVLPCFFPKNISVSTSVRKNNNGIEAPEPTAVLATVNNDKSSQSQRLLAAPRPTDFGENTVNGRTASVILTVNASSTCQV